MKFYYICRDYLGSITHVANADGSLKVEYSYDAWGRLRNPATQTAYTPGSEPVLFLGRGYTGHEYLPWFGLVNMNARLYDPALGRFSSPDPYVQMPDFSQNFNRYSYCLNNPLVYVDEDGEFFLATMLFGAFINTIIQGVSGNINNFGDLITTFGIGALSGAVGLGAGQLVAGAVGTVGFVGGALTGASGGFAGGFVGGSVNAWVNGNSFINGLKQGLTGGSFGAITGGLIGGISGGISAIKHGGDFWSGKGSIFESPAASGLKPEYVKVGEGMEYSTDYAQQIADETYGKLDYVNRIVTNEIPNPTGSDYSMTNGCIIDKNGRMLDGLTEYLGRGKSNVYLSKSAFVSTRHLKITIGHEYIHATHNFMSSKGILKARASYKGMPWTEISAHNWESHMWGVNNGFNVYDGLLGKYSWSRPVYFNWLLNAKY